MDPGKRSSKPYRLFPHTADLGMEVHGLNPSDLFAKAGWSFFDLMVRAGRIELQQEESITVEAPDREALLVAWLSELLYLFEARQLVLGAFTIRSLTSNKIQALGRGELFDLKKHGQKMTIKAITYHQLRIWEEKGIWKARVIIDL